MIPFQGQSSLKQYMPAKPIKRGIKAWCRADAHTGYMCEIQIYTSKGESSESGLGQREFFGPLPKLEPKNYHLYFDNFFSSVCLTSELLTKQIYACGTARQNYKEFPSVLKLQGKITERVEETWAYQQLKYLCHVPCRRKHLWTCVNVYMLTN